MKLNNYQKVVLVGIAYVDVYLLATVERICAITNLGAVLTSGMFIFLFHVLTVLMVIFPDTVCAFVARLNKSKFKPQETQWEGYLFIAVSVLLSLNFNYYELRGTGVYGGTERCAPQ